MHASLPTAQLYESVVLLEIVVKTSTSQLVTANPWFQIQINDTNS